MRELFPFCCSGFQNVSEMLPACAQPSRTNLAPRTSASCTEASRVSERHLDACYAQLTRHLPAGPVRERAEARLRAHPHFTVLRDLLVNGDTLPVPASARGVLLETVDGWLLLPPHDAVQLPIIARYGGFQRTDMDAALALLEARGELRGDTFVDVGANVGGHTLQAMRSGFFRRGLAVEPCPENARLLALNLQLNGLERVVEMRVCALGARDGRQMLTVDPLNCGDGRLAPAVSDRPSEGGRAEAMPDAECSSDDEGLTRHEVQVRTFDAVLAEVGLDVASLGLVWMDAQGSEGHIISASRALLDSRTPLFVEFWPHGMTALGSYRPLKTFVEERCRTMFVFEPTGPVEQPVAALDALHASCAREDRFVDLLLLR